MCGLRLARRRVQQRAGPLLPYRPDCRQRHSERSVLEDRRTFRLLLLRSRANARLLLPPFESRSYTPKMARTHKKVRYLPKSKVSPWTLTTAADGVEGAFKILEGRWKLLILFISSTATCSASRIWSERFPKFLKRCSSSSFAGWKPMGSCDESSIIRFHPRSSTA